MSDDGPLDSIPLLAAAVRADRKATDELRSEIKSLRNTMIAFGSGLILAVIGAGAANIKW